MIDLIVVNFLINDLLLILKFDQIAMSQMELEVRRRWQDRIIIDPEIHHGDACIKGTRIPIAMIVGYSLRKRTKK
jgi:hypothetical protein